MVSQCCSNTVFQCSRMMKHAGDELSGYCRSSLCAPEICVISVVLAIFQTRNPTLCPSQYMTGCLCRRLDVTHRASGYFCVFGQGQPWVSFFFSLYLSHWLLPFSESLITSLYRRMYECDSNKTSQPWVLQAALINMSILRMDQMDHLKEENEELSPDSAAFSVL